jgi:hypothetical protein
VGLRIQKCKALTLIVVVVARERQTKRLSPETLHGDCLLIYLSIPTSTADAR